MVAAAAVRIAPISSQSKLKKTKISTPTQRLSLSRCSWASNKSKPSICCSSKSDPKPEEDGRISLNESPLPSPDDVDYLWKLAAGSVGGGAAIKYGSVLFPDLTKPNILEALLMISLPVAVAVLILIKESRTEN